MYSLEQKPDCIRSQSISYFLVHDKTTSFVPTCVHPSPLGLSQLDGELLHRDQIESDLRKFDQLLYGIKTPVQLIRVNIVHENDYLVQITPDEVWVGWKIIEARGQFLKVLNSAWLLQMNPNLLEHTVVLETLADLFLAAETGGLELANPNNEKVAAYTGAGQLKLYTVLQICESAWVPTSQIEFCRALTIESQEKSLIEARGRLKEMKSQFALRPFLGNAMWSNFMRADVSERFSALEKIVATVRDKNFKLENIPEENTDWYDFVNRALEKFKITSP